MDAIKQRLSGAQWRLYKNTSLEVDGEAMPVVLRRAPPGVAVQVIDESRKGGDVDANGQPAGEVSGLRFLARIVASVLFAPGAARPLYDRNNPDDIATVMAAPWLMDLADDAMAAFGATGAVVEKLKGNSEATQT